MVCFDVASCLDCEDAVDVGDTLSDGHCGLYIGLR